MVRKLLLGDTYGTVMLVLFCDAVADEVHDGEAVGLKALHWHPQTVGEFMEQHWGVDLPQLNFDKLMAAISVVTTDLFFNDADRFIKLCNVLSGSTFDHNTFDPADVVECAWGCTEALLLDPPDADNPEPFSNEVRLYIAHVLKSEGFIQAPDILKIAIGGDRSAEVSSDFADDPAMFAMMYDTQKAKTDEVEALLKEELMELVGQLKVLPLRNGSTKELEGRIAALVRNSGDKPLN